MKLYKSFGFEFETKQSENGEMLIEGYGSTFGNRDSVGDVVQRGAFVKSLSQRNPKMLWQHNYSDLPGVWDAASEDSRGLYLKGRFVNTTLGRDVYELAKAGAIDSMSIGYGVKASTADKEKNIRYLDELALFEVSLVTFPANEQARVVAVKSLPNNVREFEAFLREAGFSKSIAVAIANHGFANLDEYREDTTEQALIESLNNLINQFKG